MTKEWKDGGDLKDRQWCPYCGTYKDIYEHKVDETLCSCCTKCNLPLSTK